MKIIKVTQQIKCSNKEAKEIAKELYGEIEKSKYHHLDKCTSNAQIKIVSMTINDYAPERRK